MNDESVNVNGGKSMREIDEGRGTRAAGAASLSSLECLSSTVRGSGHPDELHIVGNRCRSWFCPRCAGVQGPRLRAKLIDVVEGWRSPMMLTLTVDPQFFDSPEAALKWVNEQRAIARVMKWLGDFLCSPHWFCVVEWHQNGWPHWHVLCDSDRIPIDKLRQAWGRFVPSQLRHLIRKKIASLGIVEFSNGGGFKNGKHAALYASKYLTKYPEHGFPNWVMQVTYRVRRYSTSRGFWGTISERNKRPKRMRWVRRSRSHQQRMNGCCRSCIVYRCEGEQVDLGTGEVRPVRKFFKRVRFPAITLACAVQQLISRWADFRELAFVKGCFIQWRGKWSELVSAVRWDGGINDFAERTLVRLE